MAVIQRLELAHRPLGSRDRRCRTTSDALPRRASRGRLGRSGTITGWKLRCSVGRRVAAQRCCPCPTLPTFTASGSSIQHLTQQLLWEEYRRINPDGYRYSRFCELYQRWRRKQDVVLRQEHKAGEKLFVDWPRPATKLVGPLAARSPGLRLALALEIERHCSADEILQGRLIDFVAFVDVDGAPDIPVEAGVE